MNKEDLIKKWLNNDLNATEKETFKLLEDVNLNETIINEASRFKAAKVIEKTDFETFKSEKLNRTKTSKKASNNWMQTFSKIAAVLLIAFGLTYFFITPSLSTTATQIAQKEVIGLPDGSKISLNAVSEIKFNKKDWFNNRKIELKGEAFFDVEKGSRFDVITENGIISVLGTKFNVKQRGNIFEVACYEGLVSVKNNDTMIKLPAGNVFKVINNISVNNSIVINKPEWLENMSVFSKTPVHEVFNELERQFDVKVNSKAIDGKLLFTGGFKHANLKSALSSIITPLNMTYEFKTNNEVIIYDSKK